MPRKRGKEAKSGLLAPVIISTVLIISVVGLSYLFYFAWDSQIEGRTYKVAFEKDGKIYAVAIHENNVAFDNGTGNDQFYLNSFSYLGNLIALSYGDYVIDKTENPFFAGIIRATNTLKYYEQQTKYSNPKDSYQIYIFYDQNRSQIFSCDPQTENEYVVKIRPTFPMFSKQKYTMGAKQSYLNATKFLKDKLNKTLKLRTDENSKLLILSFE